MPNMDDLRNWILEEAHGSRYSIHPDSTNMYHDVRKVFWWDRLKRDMTKFVSMCPNCQQVKVQHQKSDGQEEDTIQTLEDMPRACVIDLKGSSDEYLPLVEFYYNNSYHSTISMAPFEALYGRRCRSPIG